MDWTQEEQTLLLKKVLEMVGDKVSFASAKSKVQWDKLGLNGRSAEECEKMFISLTLEIRKFRLVSEIVEEASSNIQKGFSVKSCQEMFPDFPKKPPTVINLYAADHQAEFENIDNKDRFRMMNQKWRDLPEKEKESYKKKFNKKLKKYDKKLEEFKRNHPTVIVRGLGNPSAKGAARVAAPVLPNPVALYAKNVKPKLQAKHPELNAKELQTKCTSKYQKLSDNKKLKWILEAQDQLSEYKTQCDAYLQEKPDAKLKPPALSLSKEDKKILDRHEGKPTAPPNNIFLYFCGNTDVDASLTLKDRSKKYSQLYRELSSDEQAKLREEYHKVVQTYIDEFSKFYSSLTAEKQKTEEANFVALAHFKRIVDPSSEPKKRKRPQGEQEEKPAKKAKTSKTTVSGSSKTAVDASLKTAVGASSKTVVDASGDNTEVNKTHSPLSTSEKSPASPQKKKNSPKKELNGELDDALLSFSSPVATSTQKAPTAEETKSPKSPKKQKDKSDSTPQKITQENGERNLEAEVDDAILGLFSPLTKSFGQEEESPSKIKKPKKSKKSKKKV
ncbi:nucleolar transcription factor 1 [Elysia marginata]|uniref:Nucleolar transcription factor 1 n=1 Tax=Elysia marginata TaxID=1093978 RepID=A0AAV4ENQ8_9GAST|nr:nucleolar transcription factor 1 [Elysia marginata]